MSSAIFFYVTTLLVYFGIDALAVWGLNLQYGVAGVANLAFILFQAAGAYTAAILTLGPSTGNGGFQQYVGGATLPFPLPIIAGGIVAGVLSLMVGFLGLRRLRADYLAMVLLVVAVIGNELAQSDTGLVNGPAGLALIPQPLQDVLNLSPSAYQWFYVGLVAVICVVVYIVVRRITESPFGRSLRAVRENEHAAAAVGKNVASLRLTVFVVGGIIAGISGALFVQFIGAWSPGGWSYVETLVLLTAIIVGGQGNNVGVMVGALFVGVVFQEGARLLPTTWAPAGLIAALQWIVIGLCALLFLWFWPQGLIPERRRVFPLKLRKQNVDGHETSSIAGAQRR